MSHSKWNRPDITDNPPSAPSKEEDDADRAVDKILAQFEKETGHPAPTKEVAKAAIRAMALPKTIARVIEADLQAYVLKDSNSIAIELTLPEPMRRAQKDIAEIAGKHELSPAQFIYLTTRLSCLQAEKDFTKVEDFEKALDASERFMAQCLDLHKQTYSVSDEVFEEGIKK